MVDRDGYRGVGRPSFNVKTIRINSYFPPIFCVKFLFFSYFFTLEIPIFLFFDLGSRLIPWHSGVMQVKQTHKGMGSGACLRAPEAFGVFMAKYAFS